MRYSAADKFYREEPEMDEFIILRDPSGFMGEYIAGMRLHPPLTEEERNRLRELAPGYDATRQGVRDALERQALLRKGRV